MTLWDDLLIDGTSLSTGLPDDVAEGLCLDGPWEWPYTMADQRGDLPVFQGVDGVGYADQPYSPYVLPIPATLSAPVCGDAEQSDDSWAWLNNALEQIQLACKADRLVELTRRRSLPSGGDAAHTARAKLIRITPARPGRDVLRLVIEFNQLDGIWHDVNTVAFPSQVPSTVTRAVIGTARTNRILVHFDGTGASDPKITNASNGYSLTWRGTMVAGGVDIDVEARTATETTSGTDVSNLLTWTKAQPFRLDPGDNDIQVDAATDAILSYTPAYL